MITAPKSVYVLNNKKERKKVIYHVRYYDNDAAGWVYIYI